ncbi:MAG: Crp/Fnr family transcriptional regulator [Pseudomonadota bacterium]
MSTAVKTWNAQDLLAAMAHAWPEPVSAETARLLLAHGQIQRLKTGEVMIHQGEVPHGIIIMLEGLAAVTGVNAAGREFILSLIGPGEGYGFVPCYTETPDTTSVVAHEAMAALVVPIDTWRKISDIQPDLKDGIIAVMCRRMRWMTDNLEFRSMAPAIATLAHRLYRYAEQMEPDAFAQQATGAHIEVKLSQSALASMLSLSRQRTHQLLHTLEKEGAVSLSYGRIVVRNLAVLRQFMDTTDAH